MVCSKGFFRHIVFYNFLYLRRCLKHIVTFICDSAINFQVLFH